MCITACYILCLHGLTSRQRSTLTHFSSALFEGDHSYSVIHLTLGSLLVYMVQLHRVLVALAPIKYTLRSERQILKVYVSNI